jgi:hypothetical protein
MALKIPKVGDPVQVTEPKCSGIYLLTKVDVLRKVADARSTTDATILHRDVSWDLISALDENVCKGFRSNG